MNFVIQASACDIMKVALDRINQSLERMFPIDYKSTTTRTLRECIADSPSIGRPTPIRPVYLVLQIHDELIFEIEMSSRATEIIQTIRQEMERNEHLQLLLPVKVKSGDDWESMISVV